MTCTVENPHKYFNMSSMVETNLDMTGLGRVEGALNSSGEPVLYLFYQDSLIVANFNTESGLLEPENQFSLETPNIYARVDKKARLITVEKASNNLIVKNLTTGQIEIEYPGNEEEPYSKSQDDVFSLSPQPSQIIDKNQKIYSFERFLYFRSFYHI